jgi:hypothetical protein
LVSFFWLSKRKKLASRATATSYNIKLIVLKKINMSEKFEIPVLRKHRIVEFRIDAESSQHEFVLDVGTILAGFWRILVDNKIAGTSLDIGVKHVMNWFNDPSKILREHLFEKEILNAYASVPTGDLFLKLEGGATLEMLKEHCAFESWEINCEGQWLLVNAWGEICTMPKP